jgi:hypothetical protein
VPIARRDGTDHSFNAAMTPRKESVIPEAQPRLPVRPVHGEVVKGILA